MKKIAGKRKLGDTPPAPEPAFLIPDKYTLADTSELSVTVEKETTYNVLLFGPLIR